MTVGEVRSAVAQEYSSSSLKALPSSPHDQSIEAREINLVYKGKRLSDDDSQSVMEVVVCRPGAKPKATYRFLATGVSKMEIENADKDMREHEQRNKIFVRDDLTTQGQKKELARKKLGQSMLVKSRERTMAASRMNQNINNYGFGRIEVLPNLPDQEKARAILKLLADEPGIKACMEKHRWHVGSLAELYPEGNVGQSAVCVMGLNKNKGQHILLRIRTDDLQGFRKMTGIREVLYHELAHNVHSEHDGQFFQLMRQIKKECLEEASRNDWTASNQENGSVMDIDDNCDTDTNGGTYIVGGMREDVTKLPPKELAARAALLRRSPAEEEVLQNCGCGHPKNNLFLPTQEDSGSSESHTSARRRG